MVSNVGPGQRDYQPDGLSFPTNVECVGLFISPIVFYIPREMSSLASELFREVRPGLFRVLAGRNARTYVDVLDELCCFGKCA